MSPSDGRPSPQGHQSRISIFERYLKRKIEGSARRLRPDAASTYELEAAEREIQGVVDALLDKLVERGREGMSLVEAEMIVRCQLDGSATEPVRLLGILQDEAILARERFYLGEDEGVSDGVRIVFQTFSDFLLLRRRLEVSPDPLDDSGVRDWLLNEASWGITEAATVLFPEAYEVELPDYLGISAHRKRQTKEVQSKNERRARQIYTHLVENLPYRSSDGISDRTIEILNDAQSYLSRDVLYRVMFTLAPQPNNRLNGEALHNYLSRHRMPQRDSDFGFATYHEVSDEFSPAARLARWAAEGPYPHYDSKVLELACIPLCWLLSSPNRYMRDWVTKALVQLLRGHLGVVRVLLDRFWPVDDPYVVQRVVAIAYGALLRATPGQATEAQALTQRVLELVFGPPVRPDELLLDAGRGIVRWGVGEGLLSESDLQKSMRPYGLKPPGPPPSEDALKSRYGWGDRRPDDESYGSILFSVLGMGDFGRYVVESGLRGFTRYRIGTKRPERPDRRPRIVKSRWSAFVRSLTEGQRHALEAWLEDPDPVGMGQLSFLIRREPDPLTEEQRQLFDAAVVYPPVQNDEYRMDVARRWVVRRTVGLGWTPRVFGAEDRYLGRSRGREGHKAERWGKKYQWMAYHELLARVADNFQTPARTWDNEPYEGLHQIVGEREIDPSLPPIEFRSFNDHAGTGMTAWSQPPMRLKEWPPMPLDFRRYEGDIRRLVADTSSEPTVERSILVEDNEGKDWVVLTGILKQGDPHESKDWRGLQQHVAIDAVLVPRGTAKVLLTVAEEALRDVSDLMDSHGHVDCCYFGEVGRTAPDCPHREDKIRSVVLGDRNVEVVLPTERYMWEGNILDCSIGESASAYMPSTFIQNASGLTLDVGGPSWRDPAGEPMLVHYEQKDGRGQALLVRASFLSAFLASHELELVVLHWFERMEIKDDYRGDNPYVESTVVAHVAADLTVRTGALARTDGNRGD